MRNNNRAVVRKLTRRTLAANKGRNFFIMAAIALTAFMITSVFSIGASFIASVNIMPFRAEGIHSHVAFANPSEAQMDTLRGLNYVQHYGTVHPVGTVTIPGLEGDMPMLYTDRTMWERFHVPTFTRIRGHFNNAENEIMLSRAKLSLMGITEPYVGMEIPLAFTAHGVTEPVLHTFILSAFYTEFVSAQGNTFLPAFTSQAFAQQHNAIRYDNMNVNVLFRNARHAVMYAEWLVLNLGLTEEQYQLHPSLIFSQEVNLLVSAISMGAFVVFLMLTGFLLIYNVMYASVSKDVRFYGLLKTLGTTPKQLRTLVNGQVLRLYLPGAAIGIGVTALVSLGLVPMMLDGGLPTGTVVSFSPFIFIGGALFALFTALLGARSSAKKAARVSPIEAIRYTGTPNVRTKARISAKGKPLRMAWRNVFRERKRAFNVMLGLFMGLVVFTFMISYVHSMDTESHLDYWHVFDFSISTQEMGLLGEDFTAQVAAIDGVAEINRMSMTSAVITEPQRTHVTLIGVDTGWLLEFHPDIAETLDIAAFERGESALVFNHRWLPERHMFLPDTFTLEIYGGTAPITLQNSGNIDRIRVTRGTSWFFGGTGEVVMSNNFLEAYLGELQITNLGIHVNPGTDEAVEAELIPLLGRWRGTFSRLEARRAVEDERMLMLVLGGGLSGILALIAIFNFINVMSVGLLVRRREFAALESVGMSKKQLRALVLGEGIIYWMVTLGLSATVGTGLTYWLMSLMSGSPMFHTITIPILPIAAVYGIIIIICSIIPLAANRSVNKHSLVERLREVE